jgi:hypothetical protein
MAETGHVKNVENLQKAIGFATGWGANYAPSNPMLAIGAMTALQAAGEARLDDVQAQRTPYRNATAACDDLFDPLSKRTTRIMKTLKASGVADSVQEDADTYARKIKGERKEPAVKDDPATPGIDESKKSHSASQMSRAQRLENFNSLRSLLDAQPLYAPNETDLQTVTLKTYAQDMEAAMDTVGSTFVPFSNARADRDDVLYDNDENVYKTGTLFKTYVEGAFGRSSSEWQQVKALEFRNLSRK